MTLRWYTKKLIAKTRFIDFTILYIYSIIYLHFFVASVSQKRQKDSQTGGTSKKHKPNRKSLGVPPKKNRKTGKESCVHNCLHPFYFKCQQYIEALQFAFHIH